MSPKQSTVTTTKIQLNVPYLLVKMPIQYTRYKIGSMNTEIQNKKEREFREAQFILEEFSKWYQEVRK